MVLDASKFIPAEAIEKLPTFDDKCIDLVVTAPPGFTEKGKEKLCGTSYSWDTFDDYIDYMDKVFTEVYRMLRNQRYCVVMTGDHETVCGGDREKVKKYPLAAYFTLLLESVGFAYIGEHIWYNSGKRRKSGIKEIPHYPFTVMPNKSCDHILIFKKQEQNTEPLPCPCCGSLKVKPYGYTRRGLKKWMCDDPECHGRSENGFGKVYTERSILLNDTRRDENIIPLDMLRKWRGNIVKAEKKAKDGNRSGSCRYLPEEVVEMAVRYFSGVGDYILDPFAGKGMTIFTTIALGRHFLCMENDENDLKEFFGKVSRLKNDVEMRLSEKETADR